jgi:hypothetical protein
MAKFLEEISMACTCLNKGDNTGSHFPTAQPISMMLFFLLAKDSMAFTIYPCLSFFKTSKISVS